MHKWLFVAVSLLVWVPAASAGTSGAPELRDARDDAALVTGPPVAAPWTSAIDLESVWFTDDAEGLHAHIRVADLGMLDLAEASAADFMWIAIWSPGYQEPSGAADRRGTWELRAEYRPLDDPAWHYWLERPCLDGDDSDGCAAADRDIANGLAGSVDLLASTITITAPWHHMAHPRTGDGIHGLWATAQADYPGYPARWVDWDIDQGDQCYRFRQVPTDAAAFNGTDTGPTGSSNGRQGFPHAYPGFRSCATPRQDGPAIDGASSTNSTAKPDATAPAPTVDPDPSEAPVAKESPGLGMLVLPAALGVLARRRARFADP